MKAELPAKTEQGPASSPPRYSPAGGATEHSGQQAASAICTGFRFPIGFHFAIRHVRAHFQVMNAPAQTATRLAARAIVRLSPQDEGEDVVGFLQSLVTHDVGGTLPVWAGLLTPQGKVLYDFVVWLGEAGSLLLDCEAAAAEALAKRLALYRLRRKIAIAVDPGLAVHWSPVQHEGAVPDPRLPALGGRWLAPAADGEASADAAWQAHRLALGVTEGLAELGSGETLWLECNADALNGVSFSKGCYVGQENTARMNWRHKVNRRLIVLPLAESRGDRQVVAMPEIGLAVDYRRVEDVAPALWPQWLQPTLAATSS